MGVNSPKDGNGRAPGDSRVDAPEAADGQGLSRREFAKRIGAGSAAAAGLVWVAPKISTIRYATKVPTGSHPPTPEPTTGSVPVGSLGGEISLSATSPCVGTDVRVIARGFAPHAPIALQIDSAAHAVGIATADADGEVDALVTVPMTAPTGPRTLRAVGPRAGGGTLALSVPVTIKSEAECARDDTTAGTPVPPPGDQGSDGSGSLPLTGSDAIDLAIIGGAAAIGGRVLYGASRPPNKRIDRNDR
jgi:hypothetical protein